MIKIVYENGTSRALRALREVSEQLTVAVSQENVVGVMSLASPYGEYADPLAEARKDVGELFRSGYLKLKTDPHNSIFATVRRDRSKDGKTELYEVVRSKL